MQERYLFRELLSEIKELADRNGNRLTTEEVQEFFKNAHLTEEQLKMVYAYLEGEKIRVEGYEGNQSSASAEEEETISEGDYLDFYLEELGEIEKITAEEELSLFQMATAGDAGAKKRLTEQYLQTVFDLSQTYAFGPVPRGDIVQEGNVALMLALEELEFSDDLEDYQRFLYEKINEAMEEAVTEGRDLKEMDEKVAQRVNHLSEAIHNLEEDLERKVSEEELSAYLDMPLEEIRDILKMAGDEIEIEK